MEKIAPKTLPSPCLIINWQDNGTVSRDDIVFKCKGLSAYKIDKLQKRTFKDVGIVCVWILGVKAI